jgi:hypothetical protein
MSKSSNRNPELWKALAKKLLEDPDLVQRFLDATEAAIRFGALARGAVSDSELDQL